MKVRRTSARRGAGLRSALRVVSHAPVVAFLGCVVAIAAEPASPGPAAGTPCVAAAALDSGTEVDFEVYLDGKKSGGARLVDSAMPGGGRLITLSYRSSYLWTTFEHASREVWRDGQLVCASGTGVNKGFANLEPDVDIGVTRAKSGGTYEWRVDERGFDAKDEPVLLFDAPLLAETFWLEPAVGAISVVNLGRSAVYAADVQRLGDELVEGVRTRHYRVAGPKLAGGRASAEGLQRELWYDAHGLVRVCGKETYRMTVMIETIRTAPRPKAPPDAPPHEAAAPAKSCDEIFPR